MADRLGIQLGEKDRTPKLLCFPVERHVASSQITTIVDITALELREMLTCIQNWMREQGNLLVITKEEIVWNAGGPTTENTMASRRTDAFSSSTFTYGVYAVSRILLAQAQENMDFQDRGQYPQITSKTYMRLADERFDRREEKELRMRQRFIKETVRLQNDQPELANALHAIVEGAELRGDRQIDFYGGAAFAYELFRHAYSNN